MLSFAVTAYEEMSSTRLRGARLVQSIESAMHHDAVDEIMVVDDGSSDWPHFESLVDALDSPKIHLYHNDQNLGVFGNKLEAKACCTNEWVVTCDSDNVMGPEFFDKILEQNLDPGVWYCPSFARPDFDYRVLVGEYGMEDIPLLSRHRIFGCAVNTGNQTVHREAFLEVFGRFRGHCRFDLMLPNYLGLSETERQRELWHTAYGANDSCLYNLLWLQAGNRLNFLAELEYDHYRADGDESNYNRAPKEKLKLSDHLLGLLQQGQP